MTTAALPLTDLSRLRVLEGKLEPTRTPLGEDMGTKTPEKRKIVLAGEQYGRWFVVRAEGRNKHAHRA